VKKVTDASVMSVKFLESCTPGYYNNEGQPNGLLIRRNGSYAPGIMAFSSILDGWRNEGKLEGIQFDKWQAEKQVTSLAPDICRTNRSLLWRAGCAGR
jgi:hypothetical protein